jgi:hypothetical protein
MADVRYHIELLQTTHSESDAATCTISVNGVDKAVDQSVTSTDPDSPTRISVTVDGVDAGSSNTIKITNTNWTDERYVKVACIWYDTKITDFSGTTAVTGFEKADYVSLGAIDSDGYPTFSYDRYISDATGTINQREITTTYNKVTETKINGSVDSGANAYYGYYPVALTTDGGSLEVKYTHPTDENHKMNFRTPDDSTAWSSGGKETALGSADISVRNNGNTLTNYHTREWINAQIT